MQFVSFLVALLGLLYPSALMPDLAPIAVPPAQVTPSAAPPENGILATDTLRLRQQTPVIVHNTGDPDDTAADHHRRDHGHAGDHPADRGHCVVSMPITVTLTVVITPVLTLVPTTTFETVTTPAVTPSWHTRTAPAATQPPPGATAIAATGDADANAITVAPSLTVTPSPW